MRDLASLTCFPQPACAHLWAVFTRSSNHNAEQNFLWEGLPQEQLCRLKETWETAARVSSALLQLYLSGTFFRRRHSLARLATVYSRLFPAR